MVLLCLDASMRAQVLGAMRATVHYCAAQHACSDMQLELVGANDTIPTQPSR